VNLLILPFVTVRSEVDSVVHWLSVTVVCFIKQG